MSEIIRENDIVNGLQDLGLPSGAAVMVHSALSSFGNVEGGADTVIDALLKVVGKEGTIIVPTFSSEKPFRIKKSPTLLGTIPEALRNRKDSVRSLHPLVPVSAIGENAEYIVADHENCDVPQGIESPYGKVIELNGYVLLLGVDLDRCTLMHTFEIQADAPYLSEISGEYIDRNGNKTHKNYKQFPGPHRDFIGLGKRLEKAGIIKKIRIGCSIARLMKAKDLISEGLKAMEEDTAAVLCENPRCDDCVTQRSRIFKSKLQREDFKLSAVSDCAGRYIDEIIENLNKFAIPNVEIFHIQGKELFQLDPEEVDHIFHRFGRSNIKISGLKISNAGYYELTEKIARYHKVNTIIAPLAPDAADKMSPPKNLSLLLENVSHLSSEISEIMRPTSGSSIRLALNPYNLARIKEKPFLEALTKGRIKKYIHQLYINDGTYQGDRTELAEGNAEIKELISIMRCSSFDGYFVIESAPKGFQYTLRRFWDLIDQT